MIKISVNDETRNYEDINPSWIHEQIRGRLSEGVAVCVIIQIKKPGIDVSLTCGNCGSSGGGGGRAPNNEETRIFALWDDLGCKQSPVNSGNIVAFLSRVKSL